MFQLNTSMTHLISPELTARQRNLLTGTILGGSSLVRATGSRNCYLSMRSKDVRWLEFKAGELACLASGRPFTTDTTNRWHSMCYPIFNQLYNQFYDDGRRKLNMEALDLLSDVAFAAWFGDAGTYPGHRVLLNTHVWGEVGSQLIVEYFDAIGFKAEMVRERGSFRVRLDGESSLAFFRIAEPHLPLWFLRERFE